MKKDTLYDPAKVNEFKGVHPAQIADLLALVGDTSDNIPGAPGIGDKGAVAAPRTVRLRRSRPRSRRRSPAQGLPRKPARTTASRSCSASSLATIRCDVPLDFTLDSLAVREPDQDALADLYRELRVLQLPQGTWLEAAAARRRTRADRIRARRHRASSTTGNASGRPPTAGKPVEDVLLYAFLVLADPSACALDSLIARYLERPGAPRRKPSAPSPPASAPPSPAELRRIYDDHRPAPHARPRPHGTDRHPHRARPSSTPSPERMDAESIASPTRSTRSPASPSTSTRHNNWARSCSRS